MEPIHCQKTVFPTRNAETYVAIQEWVETENSVPW